MDPKVYLEMFFATRQPTGEDRRSLLEEFCNKEEYLDAARQILSLQDMLMKNFIRKNRVEDIRRQQVLVPNGTVGKAYEAYLIREQYGWNDVIHLQLEGLEASGLLYDPATGLIGGIPEQAGDFKLRLKFRLEGDEATDDWWERTVPLIINPDPRSLWKELPSDNEGLYWKEDTATVSTPLGDRHLVVASKRGRSHANTGSFRDDDFAFKHFEASGWSVIAVSDGAGSARYSREGARLACNSVLAYFEQKFADGSFAVLDILLPEVCQSAAEDVQKKVSLFIYNYLGGAAKYVYNQLEALALGTEAALKDFHATLIFTLVKKYDFGYAVLSFGVGDCPIGLLYDDLSSVTLMNTLDVGEFGGGTRFITMPEIFQSDTFAGRFGFKIVKDLDYLMLMTDGIYDPKFEVEANLVKPEKWQSFLDDLKGNNPEKVAVRFDPGNTVISEELSAWMNFWSPGNHDDRTLAILF